MDTTPQSSITLASRVIVCVQLVVVALLIVYRVTLVAAHPY